MAAALGPWVNVLLLFALGNRLEYRLAGLGIVYWEILVAIRLGNFALEDVLGANLAERRG